MENKKAIEDIKTNIEELSKEIKKVFSKDKEKLQKTLSEIDKVGESWSGSWAGFHANFYYQNFEKPPWNQVWDSEWGSLNPIPSYWQEKSYEDIVRLIASRIHRVDIDELREKIVSLLEKAGRTHREVCIELSFIRGLDRFEKEIDLLNELEKHKWGTTAQNYVSEIAPKQFVTRDTLAGFQGFRVPHIYNTERK